ncbi:hypothetical protein [Flavobacterium davisii]|uniref:hypothetical protein n=1 Tax=Flavobacterium davisii TaxID=2906077 RepID=UPI00216476E5|nr:hypothetical protein [Flavobacterium davisii]
MWNEILIAFVLIPFAGFFISFWLPEKKESWLSWTVLSTVIIQLFTLTVFLFYWVIKGAKPFNLFEVSLVKTNHYEFFIDFFLIK